MRKKSVLETHNFQRLSKRNKTQGYKNKRSFTQPLLPIKHKEQIISDIIEDLFKFVNQRITKIVEQEYAKEVVKQTINISYIISGICCPEEDQVGRNFSHIDLEPQRIDFDPICGFNKLVKIPHRKQYFDWIKEKNKSSTSYIHSQANIRKKSTMKINYDNEDQLVPLIDQETESARVVHQYETILRDRMNFGTRTLLIPNITHLSRPKITKETEVIKTSKTSAFLQNIQKNLDYVYGFNGEKQVLNLTTKKLNTNLNFGGNNILKTSYKITQLESSKRFGQKRITFQSKPKKIIHERKLSKFTSRPESINMMQFLPQNSQNGEVRIKKILENELRKNFNENVRWKQTKANQRASKLL